MNSRKRNIVKLKILELPVLLELIDTYCKTHTKLSEQEEFYKRRIISDIEGYYQKNYDFKKTKKIKVKLTRNEWELVNRMLSSIDEEDLYYKNYEKQDIVCHIKYSVYDLFRGPDL